MELKKDAANSEMLRGAVRTQRSADIRMGKPVICNRMTPMSEYITHEGGTRGTETSKYPEEKKINNDSVSSGERKRRSPNQFSNWGCRTTTRQERR